MVITPFAAHTRLPSSNTIFGDLPPSSSVTRLKCCAASIVDLAAIFVPTRESGYRDLGVHDERAAAIVAESGDDVVRTLAADHLTPYGNASVPLRTVESEIDAQIRQRPENRKGLPSASP